VIADLSVNHVEGVILRCGFSVVRNYGSDYGIDLVVYTYTADGEPENGEIKFQLKATDRLPILADGKTISLPIGTADLAFWGNEKSPVILVVYDAMIDRSYWVDAREFARTRAPGPADWRTKTVNVLIPMANRFTVRALRGLRAKKNRLLET
jgi:hypothetical protein